MICDNISQVGGRLRFADQDVTALAQRYGTPLYLMDEDRIRHNCRIYKDAMAAAFGDNALPLYASKAASFKRIYKIVSDEGMGIDVVSSGEIFTAVSAGVSLENAYFHSNNKTDEDIAFAMEHGIGYFVADNEEEIDAVEKCAARMGRRQKVLLRITPGIDTHTYEAVNTGKVDSKFGSAIATGQAREIVRHTLGKEHIELCGFHCHIGSQVFDSDTFLRGSDIMLDFIADMKKEFGYSAAQLNLGGGYGVRYVEDDPVIDIAENIASVACCIKGKCASLGISVPKILMEPGRSIVADAGMTVYTVGTVKKIPEYKNYVSVDGGMTDNPRFALYGSVYTVFLANRMDEERSFECSVVGRCCESGDIIAEHIFMPEPVRGDTVAVCTTGAYNYSMASNYNRIPRPPIVMLSGGESYVAVRRETLYDIVNNDL